MTRSEIIKLLNALRKDLNLTYLVISHDIDAMASLADEIAVMYFGSIVEYGLPARSSTSRGTLYSDADGFGPRASRGQPQTTGSSRRARRTGGARSGCAYYDRAFVGLTPVR